MQNRLTVAAVQMNSGADCRDNLNNAVRLIEQAARNGAQLVALPELFLCLTRFEDVVAAAEPVPGPTSNTMSALATRWGIHLLAGSFCERSDVTGKGYNTSLIFGPDGQLLNRYRKLHLFDVDLPGQVVVQESKYMLRGDRMVVTDTPLARLGHSICYDLRFPELFRSLAQAGCEIMLIPSAFTRTTGQDHWQVLLRARADHTNQRMSTREPHHNDVVDQHPTNHVESAVGKANNSKD